MKRKKFLILFLILLLVVGYAAVTSTLNITGLTKVGENKNDFDVYFSNAKEGNKEGTVENKKVIKDDTHITFTKDMKSVGETYVLEYDVTNGSRTYDANISITCTESTEYLKITNEFDTTTNLPATETRSGKLTVEVIKSYVGTTEKPTLDTTISCEITGNAQERTSKATGTPAAKVVQEKPWKLTNDIDWNSEISIGDLITLGTESFYVYDTTGDNIKALAQYNLYVGNTYDGSNLMALEKETGLQDSTAIGWKPNNAYPFIGTVEYDSTAPYSNEYADSTIKTLVDAYGEKLDAINGGEKATSSIGLITKEELEELGCDGSSENTCTTSSYPWVYSTSYWTSSPQYVSYVWRVASDGVFSGYVDASYAFDFGVRPVITVSKAIIEVPKITKPWKLTNDADSNGELSIGDLITLGTESFYVYNVDGDNVKALAQYNLFIGNGVTTETGLQDATAKGWVDGSDTYVGTVESDNMYDFIYKYGTKLNELNGNLSNFDLITKEELDAIGCDSSSNTCTGAPAWVYATSYWTNSYEPDIDSFWFVASNGVFDNTTMTNGDNFGVRPVITIAKFLIG